MERHVRRNRRNMTYDIYIDEYEAIRRQSEYSTDDSISDIPDYDDDDWLDYEVNQKLMFPRERVWIDQNRNTTQECEDTR